MNLTQIEIGILIKVSRRHPDLSPEDIISYIVNGNDVKTGLMGLLSGTGSIFTDVPQFHRPTTEKIIKAISKYHGLQVSKVESSSRKEELVRARQQFCLIAALFRYSQEAIGMEIGGRDHSTAYNGKAKALKYCATERDYLDEVKELIKLFPRYKVSLLERLELLMEKS